MLITVLLFSFLYLYFVYFTAKLCIGFKKTFKNSAEIRLGWRWSDSEPVQPVFISWWRHLPSSTVTSVSLSLPIRLTYVIEKKRMLEIPLMISRAVFFLFLKILISRNRRQGELVWIPISHVFCLSLKEGRKEIRKWNEEDEDEEEEREPVKIKKRHFLVRLQLAEDASRLFLWFSSPRVRNWFLFFLFFF